MIDEKKSAGKPKIVDRLVENRLPVILKGF